MKNYIILLVFLVQIFSCKSSAIDKMLAIKPSSDEGFQFIDYNGNLIFQLPIDQIPQSNVDFNDRLHFHYIDFSSGAVVIKERGNLFLINKSGEKIKEFNSAIFKISNFENGYYRAYQKANDICENCSLITYYDSKGALMFEGRKFWEADNFHKGATVVQLNNDQGDWLLIDILGHTIHNLTDTLGGNLKFANRYTGKFKDGYWKMYITNENGPRNRRNRIFISPNGEILKSMPSNKSNSFWNTTMASDTNLKGFGLDVNRKKRVVINGKNTIMSYTGYRYNNKEKAYYVFSHKLADGSSKSFKYFIYDQDASMTSEIKDDTKESFTFKKMHGRYIQCSSKDKEGNSFISFYDIVNPSKVKLELNKSDHDAFSRMLVYKDNEVLIDVADTYSVSTIDRVNVIYNLSGKIIYQTKAQDIIYKDLEQALKFKSKVKFLELSDVDENTLLQLSNFPNLKHLQLWNSSVKTFPNDFFLYFKGLSKFSIRNFSNITKMPDSFYELKKLHTFNVVLCGKINKITFLNLLNTHKYIKNVTSDIFNKKDNVQLPKRITYRVANVFVSAD